MSNAPRRAVCTAVAALAGMSVGFGGAAAGLGGLAAGLGGLAAAAAAQGPGAPGSSAPGPGEYAPVCSHGLAAGSAACDSIQLLNPAANWHGSHVPGDPVGASAKRPGNTETTKEPSGYHPADLQSAYGLAGVEGPSAISGGTQAVAIVDAYDDPNAEADVRHYREQFHLAALPSCGGSVTASCFEKVNQLGERGKYPSANTSWSEEISLDLDMVSAICQRCKILLVEASSNSLSNLAAAEEYAVAHANAASNSYGGSEFSGETSYDHAYEHAGVAVTASSGDSGYGVEYPAASPFLTAVGGTSLSRSSSARGWNETVWSGAGAGCSAVEPNPGWQPVTSRCTHRTVADTAADANPNTGVSVYDTYGEPGWLVFGGTSVASPIVASVYALAENASGFSGNAARALYGATSLNRVREGYDVNAHRCASYLCGAPYSLTEWTIAGSTVHGWYNGPTGNGTPAGLTAF